jgi:hypothetical protein
MCEVGTYVMFPSARSFIVLVFIVSLHVLAYMAIFKCVGSFICICLKDSASLLFGSLPFFMFPCARSFIVLVSTVFHYVFRPT